MQAEAAAIFNGGKLEDLMKKANAVAQSTMSKCVHGQQRPDVAFVARKYRKKCDINSEQNNVDTDIQDKALKSCVTDLKQDAIISTANEERYIKKEE